MNLADIFVALEDDLSPLTEAHARHDLDVEAIRLRKSDALSYWSAELDVINPGGGPFQPGAKRAVIISERDEDTGALKHVLSGYLEAWPIGPAGRVVTLTVLAKPKNAEAVTRAALLPVQDDPFNLFGDPAEAFDPSVRLAARSATLHWSRDALAAPELVDIVDGKPGALIDIGQGYIEDGLRFEQLEQPVERIDVTLRASWTQALLRMINVGAAMANDGRFVTLQPPEWRDVPRAGQKVGDWTVLRSSIETTNLPSGLSALTPAYQAKGSANKRVADTQGDETYAVQFQRKAYDLDLMVGAVLTAKRTETITFSLIWDGQPLSGTSGRVETIELELRNLEARAELPEWAAGVGYQNGDRVEADGLRWQCRVPHISGSTLYANFDNWDPLVLEPSVLGGSSVGYFFGQPSELTIELESGGTQNIFRNPAPGPAALAYAINRARAQMLSANRLVRAVVEVPWADVRDALQGMERLRVADPDIPGGEMTGKIESVEVDLVEGVASITIACIPGRGRRDPVAAVPLYGSRGFDNVGVLRADVVNDYVAQEAALAAGQGAAGKNLVSEINRNATRFEIELMPVPKGGDLAVTIPIGVLALDAPKQIDLEAAE